MAEKGCDPLAVPVRQELRAVQAVGTLQAVMLDTHQQAMAQCAAASGASANQAIRSRELRLVQNAEAIRMPAIKFAAINTKL
jgi:hypothetical protein